MSGRKDDWEEPRQGSRRGRDAHVLGEIVEDEDF